MKFEHKSQILFPVIGMAGILFVSIFYFDFKICMPKIYTASQQNINNLIGQDKKDYVKKIIVRPFKVSQISSGDFEVVGEIKNSGNRILTKVGLIIYLLDKYGKPVAEKVFYPIETSEHSTIETVSPLKPNYSRKFRFRTNDNSSEWSKEVKGEIIVIEFEK